MSLLFEAVQSMLSVDVGHNSTTLAHTLISFPPGSDRLPVIVGDSDVFAALFEVLVHWIAYFIACTSVTVSLLVCMTIVLLSCVCILEMVIQSSQDMVGFVRRGASSSKIF